MKNRGLVAAVIVMAIVILALSVLSTFLIAERSTLEKIEQAYGQGKEDGQASAQKEKPAETALEDLEPWEQYAKGYVWYAKRGGLYHIQSCEQFSPGHFELVPEEYAVATGGYACELCLRGSENTYDARKGKK